MDILRNLASVDSTTFDFLEAANIKKLGAKRVQFWQLKMGETLSLTNFENEFGNGEKTKCVQ